MSVRRAALFAALLVAACGGDEPPRAGAATPDVLLVALEGVRPERLGEPRLAALAPHLAALGAAVELAPSDGGRTTPQVATLLGGHAGHGLVSARELGFHRLEAPPAAVRDARALGFEPLGAVALPQLEGGLTGLAGAFAHWDTVGTGSPRRTARPDEVAERLVAAVDARRAADAPLLVFAQLSAPPLGEVGLPPVANPALVAAPFRAAADALTRELGAADAAELLALADAGDLATLVERCARRRGSRAAACVEEAVADLWLVAIDAAVARVVDALRPRGEPHAVAVALAPSAARRPDREPRAFAVGAPGAAALADVLPRALRAAAGEGARLEAVLEAVTHALEDGAGHGAAGLLAVEFGPGHAWHLSLRAADDGAFEGLTLVRAAAPGFAESVPLDAPRRGDRVELELAPDDVARVVTVRGPARGLPLWVELRRDGAPVPEADVLVAGRPLPASPVPRLLDARGDALPEPTEGEPAPERPPVRFVAAGGGRLALAAGGDLGAARFAAWPPDPDGALPAVDPAGAVRAGPGRSLAVALPRAGGYAAASTMAHADRRALGPGLVLILPGYDDLALEREHLFRDAEREADPPLAPGAVHLWRPGPPFPPGPAITPSERRFLRQLPAGE